MTQDEIAILETDPKEQELMDNCTRLQRQFVINMISGQAMIEAYINAGGKAKTNDSQRAVSSEIFAKPNVQALYRYLEQKAMIVAKITKIECVKILSDIARTKITDLISFETKSGKCRITGEDIQYTQWHVLNSENLPDAIAHSIKSVTMTKMGPKIELRDSIAALKELNRMQGWIAPQQLNVEQHNRMSYTKEDVSNALKGLMDFL